MFIKWPMEKVLGFMPNPTESKPVTAKVIANRCYNCPGYSACLFVACKNKWDGLTCIECQVYDKFFDIWTRIIRKV